MSKKRTTFGKTALKTLIDLDKSQKWLKDEVIKETGLYCDNSYLNKIFFGEKKSPKIIKAICNILNISEV